VKKAAVLPVAFLAGCSLRPWTPSTVVAYWGDDTPNPQSFTVPSQTEALARWQLPATNPWGRYSKYTLLTVLDSVPRSITLPDISQLEVVVKADAAAYRVSQAGLPQDAMWMVDLRGAASVTFGASLSRRAREPVACVPTFNNWPAENELIPAEEALAALTVGMQPRLPQATDVATRPVFMLDSWRLAYRTDVPDDDVTDNRYILNSGDLPDAEALRAQGIKRVIYVVEDLDETESEEDDVHGVLLAYQQAGITIYMVDLQWLIDQPQVNRWDELLARRAYTVEPRRTLIDDPAFYARARGGFGGIHSGPSPLRTGIGWGGWRGPGWRGGGYYTGGIGWRGGGGGG
jgi:hypothetical protein